MDLRPGQRAAMFAVAVMVLAALGYFLVVPAVSRPDGAAKPASPATPSTRAPRAFAQPTATAAVPPAAGTVDIYSWLPFTQQDLADAAAVTVQFCVDYDTYSYAESPAAYVATMNGLITGELAGTLQGAYAAPGVAQLRTGQRQVSAGTAAIDSLRAFGPSSMTFVVTAWQRLVSSHGTTSGATQYAVTVTGSGGSWRASDIELASAGNT
ncbi:MAG: hypothetical protein JO132_16640 [Streptosporangiaceae bacterium]|nr:hypothetical protein [Streptosporangiaceae bacterium]